MNEDFEKHITHALQAEIVGVDTETTGIEGIKSGADYLVGIGIAYDVPDFGTFDTYFPFRHSVGENLPLSYLQPVEEILKTKTLVFHNRPFDLHSLHTIGINIDRCTNIQYDTQVMAHMADENLPSKELDWLSKVFLNDSKDKSELDKWTKSMGWKDVPSHVMFDYGRHDPNLTLRLLPIFMDKLRRQDMLHLLPIEQEYGSILYRMEQEAIKIDPKFIQDKIDQGETLMGLLASTLGFVPTKPTELGKYLIEELGLPVVKRTPNGAPSFNKEAIEKYDELLQQTDSPVAQMILEYRGWATFLSLFCYPMLAKKTPQNYIHTNYKQHGTVTGRLSSSGPNLQQIPRASTKAWNGNAKRAFLAEDDFRLWGFDYSQLELRLAASYGNEQTLIDEFSKDDSNVFTTWATQLSFKRQTVKNLSYTILYGGGLDKAAYTIAKGEDLPLGDSETHRAYYETFKESIPGIIAASNLATQLAKSRGYIRYWTGRRRHLSFDHYRAFNALLQGGGADVVKRAQIALVGIEDENCKMVLQVHDEIVFKIRKNMYSKYARQIIPIMENFPDFGVRFKVEGKLWNR